MSILPKIYTLKDETQNQFYEWFDKEIRPFPKKSDGSIDLMAEGLVDNDVDALRHEFTDLSASSLRFIVSPASDVYLHERKYPNIINTRPLK